MYSSSSHGAGSSDPDQYDATGAFNSDTTGTNTWATLTGKYSGTYNGSESTNGYAGEWLQVDIGQSVVLTSYSFKTKDDVNDNYDVKKMRLFSSNDGTNWTQIQDWTDLTAGDWATGKTVGPYNAPANTTGRYFRIVLNELQNTAGVYGQIAVFDLRGITAAQQAANEALARGDPITTTYPTSTLTNGYATTGSILDISGLETNITKLSSTFPALFPGNTTGGSAAEATKFGWVGSANADTLSLETTDEKDTRTMDLHIWKITITL